MAESVWNRESDRVQHLRRRVVRSLAIAMPILMGISFPVLLQASGKPSRPAGSPMIQAAALPISQTAALPISRTAALVVDVNDGRVWVRAVPVTGSLSGLQFLQQSGISVIQKAGAVCAIGGTGCPATDCFCACPNGSPACRYWSYYHGVGDGGWQEAMTGAAQFTVTAGAVEGWVWSGERPPVTATAAFRAAILGYEWLRTKQGVDGSMAEHGGLTGEAVLAARATGARLAGPWPQPKGALDPDRRWIEYLRRIGGDYSLTGPAQAGKLAAAAAAGHQDARRFGLDLVGRLNAGYDAQTGHFGPSVWDQSWALLGLAAAGESIPPAAVQALATERADGGGWGFAAHATEGDPDSTGLALQALVAAGEPVTGTAVQSGLAYLESGQQGDGGWGHGGASNVNSTAYALQAILAAGEDPQAGRWVVAGNADPADPVRFLLDQQRAGGYFQYDAFPADLVATLQTVPALAGRTLAMPGAGAASRRGLAWMRAHRTADGGFDGFNPGATIDAVLAMAAWGQDPREPAPSASSGSTAEAFLAAAAPQYAAQGASAAGKLLTVASLFAAKGGAVRLGGVDLVAKVLATYQPVSGTFGSGGTWDSAWAILGLRAAGARLPDRAADGLLAAGAKGGGWGFSAQADAADADSTGLALQALAAAGLSADHPAVRSGIAALRRLQNADGGFAGYGGSTSVDSTALAVGGLTASAQRVDGPGWMRSISGTLALNGPLDAILARQSPQGGFAGYAGTDDPGATYAAVLALAGRPLPLGGTADPHARPLYLPAAIRRYSRR